MAGRLNSKMKAKRIGRNDKGNDKSEEDFDTSILTKPFETSVNNLGKVFKLYESTTEEIRAFLVHECDILYECRVCRSIFRSISNFILHKRLFCHEKYGQEHTIWPRKDDECLDVILKESITVPNKNEEVPKKNLNSIIEGLAQKKQFGFKIDNFSIDEFYKQNQDIFNGPIERSIKKLDLEQIEGSSSAVFQTLKSEDRTKFDNIKLETLELHQMTEGQTAILGPDGKVVNINSKHDSSEQCVNIDDSNLTCKKCNITFATRKTFLSHLKYKHESSRYVYPCLECSDTFATIWSVYRHLYNVHRRTMPEVRKMRAKIQAKAFRKMEEPEGKCSEGDLNNSPNAQQKIDDLNQEWMNSFETDNDIQMCGGCGRRFERKAALNSHSQTCQKRIAAKNLINANKQKRKAASEEKIAEKKNIKINKVDTETDRKFFHSQNVAKKRKIGIQIRCDYSKRIEKNTTPTTVLKNDAYTFRKIPLQTSNDAKTIIEPIDKQKALSPQLLISYINSNISDCTKQEADLQEAEIVSIPSSNSSPSKDDQDPLAIKDSPHGSDSEIEEIIGPIPNNNIFEDDDILNYDIKENFEDDDKEKLSNINESTLKLIKLINSDISIENVRPSLDEKMTNYVNMKKLACIPCDIKFGNISKLRYHMSTHFNWFKFRCDICSFNAYDKADVIEHIKQVHNIQKCEKIEAITLQILDWETIELSSKEFIPRDNTQNITLVNTTPSSDNVKKEDISITCTSEMDTCIIIEPESDEKSGNSSNINKVKSLKKKGSKFKSKIRKSENTDTNIKELLNYNYSESNQSDKDPIESSSLSSDSQEQELKKMVYEVIFGDVAVNNPIANSTTSSSSSEEKDNVQIVSSNDVSNVISRPVRNRMKHIDKDFIYDMNEFKEQQNTVLPSNTNRSSIITSVSNKISELLEDNNLVVVSGNGTKNSRKSSFNKSFKNPSKNYLENMDNIVQKLNLQKKPIAKFASTSSGSSGVVGAEEFSADKVTIVDPRAFLNDVSDGDDDIYIVENEELVAVK